METQNQSTEPKKVTKSYYKTMEDKIVAMRLAFDNATLPEILAKMLTVGYTRERIDAMIAKLDVLEQKKLDQTKESAESVAAVETFNRAKEELHADFINDLKLLRILFTANTQARSLLGLDGTTPKAYGNWFDTFKNLYRQIKSDANMQALAATVGVTAEVVKTRLDALAAVDVLRETARKEGAEATAATDARDVAYDEVYPLYTEYIKYAKILLDANQLKALGV